MAVKIFQPSEWRDQVKKSIRDGMSLEEVLAHFPVSKTSFYRWQKEVQKEIQDEKAGRVAEDRGAAATGTNTGSKVVKSPQDLAVVTSKAPGPIIFRIGEQNIDLNPAHLYDAYRYCEDIKRIDPSIDDDFSLMVKAACKHAWEVFSEREARRLGANVELVEEVR